MLNPFALPLAVTVTQAVPSGITVLATDGALGGSSIAWTHILAPNGFTNGMFIFSLSAAPGASTNLSPPTVFFSDMTTNSVSLESAAARFNGLFPVQIAGSIPAGLPAVDVPMQLSVTNFTSANQTGTLTVSLINSAGTAATNLSQSFLVSGSGSTVLTFTLPGSLSPGQYSLAATLTMNGGAGQVLAGTYTVPLAPITLGVTAPPWEASGPSFTLQGPTSSNCLIQATTDISTSTNWQPIMYFPAPTLPLIFSDPLATNFTQRFYRALLQ